ncbi:MAG: hypothetical protein F6K30_13570 [Cyanothece sp. SIO2G6]|nr:hypothetical protein [Cyanothece sp. SIO2G6]
MNLKPDFATLTTPQLRTYVLEHRDDRDALHAYLDRRRSENPHSQVYTVDDDVSEAIANYLQNHRPQEAS